jgi:hypothetical protein
VIHVTVRPRRSALRWTRGRTMTAKPTAYPSASAPFPCKDFSTVPVCGSVRSSAAQRRLLAQRS